MLGNCSKRGLEYSGVLNLKKIRIGRHISEKCENGHFEQKSDENQNNS